MYTSTQTIDIASILSNAGADADAPEGSQAWALAQVAAAIAGVVRTLDDIGALSMARRHGGPDPMDLAELDEALGMAIDMAHAAIASIEGGHP